MRLDVMNAIIKDRTSFISSVNRDFREWARLNGADSGIRQSLPNPKKGGSGILPRTQLVTNLHEFEQSFDCACGFTTHIAGQFWDHIQVCNKVEP